MGKETEHPCEKLASQTEGMYHEIFNKFPDPIALVNTETGKLIEVNDAFTKFTERNIEEFNGENPLKIGKFNQKDEEIVQKSIENNKDFSNVEITFGAGSFNEKIGLVSGKKIEFDGKSCFMYKFNDITERKKNDEEKRYLVFHDPMTGLYNRYFLKEEVERLDTQRQLPLGIMMFDIDGLKLTNDVFGHLEGDNLIKATAEVFRKVFRSEDIVARVGGDEFVALLPKFSKDGVENIIKRIKDECALITDQKIPLNISIGMATKEKKEENMVEKIKEADNNMYKDKVTRKDLVLKEILSKLEQILREKDLETEDHIVRVIENSLKLGKEKGLSDCDMENLYLLAYLHDVGKVAISEALLNKNDKLTNKEQKEIELHPQIGHNIVKLIPWYSSISNEILFCHENWDGSGYPNGKKGEEIPVISRIVHLVDAYDVMTNDRPYKKAMTKEGAISEIKKYSGIQFDPELVKIFVEILKNEDISKNKSESEYKVVRQNLEKI